MSENNNRKYWSYKIYTKAHQFFWEEVQKGWLRQGWSHDERFNLSLPADQQQKEGSNKNVKHIYDWVKKGDIIVVLRMPGWHEVALLEATDDFDKGYQFEIDSNLGDFGHKFPVRFLKKYRLGNKYETAGLRRAMWYFPPKPCIRNIGHLEGDINAVLNANDAELEKVSSADEKILLIADECLADAQTVHENFRKFFTANTWEDALVDGLRQLYPTYEVIRTAGAGEKHHGTDILVKIPSIHPEKEYAIAIQVKDYNWVVGEHALVQIQRAESWQSEYVTLIDKILILINAPAEKNSELSTKAHEIDESITIMYAEQLSELLHSIIVSYIARTNR